MSDVHPSEAEGRRPTVRESIRVVRRMKAGEYVDCSQLAPEILAEVNALVELLKVPGPLAARDAGGFTHEDLRVLNMASYRYGFCPVTESCDGCDRCDADWARFRSVAARIASLLPPEKT